MLRISTHYKLYEENETWYGFKGRPKIKNQHYKDWMKASILRST